MNKKLMAVAVAGVFAAPAAFAQVTVSGKLGIQLTNMSISNLNAARVDGANSSTLMVNDNASILRIGAAVCRPSASMKSARTWTAATPA